VLLPNFARHARDATGELREQYVKTLGLYTSVVWPMYALAAVLAPEIIGVMFGKQWSESAPLLRLLCVGAIVQAAYAFAGELLGGMGQAGARLRINGVTTPVWVVLCLLASFISVKAVALASAAQAALVLVLYLRQLNRLVGFTAGDLVRSTRTSALLAVSVAVSAVAARVLLQGQISSDLLIAVVVGAVAAMAWLLAAFISRHPISHEVSTLWNRLMRRRAPHPL
jgi:O-antigen/teichoic acid export membrane protein